MHVFMLFATMKGAQHTDAYFENHKIFDTLIEQLIRFEF